MSFNPELLEIFSTDVESEEEGVWVDVTDTISFKIRAIGAKRVIERSEQLKAPFAGLVKAGGKIPEKKADEIGLKVLATAVLADWKGVTDAEGNDLPFDADNALRLLTDLPRLATFVMQTSTGQESYRQSNREDDAKN